MIPPSHDPSSKIIPNNTSNVFWKAITFCISACESVKLINKRIVSNTNYRGYTIPYDFSRIV